MDERNEVYIQRKEFFNSHAQSWCHMWYRDESTGEYDRHKKDFERLFSMIPLKKGDCVLDVGCGTGVLVPFILDRIERDGVLYELDYAEEMIKVNQDMHRGKNIHFIIADVEDMPVVHSFCDVVICFSCFPHFHNKKKAMASLAMALKHNGLMVISHFDSSEGINRHHSSCKAVMHDRLPDEAHMRLLFQEAGIHILDFIDEPGFYYILGEKR
ncbi:MAG TPA: class I SAM-dependent methyltransferase [Syntrophorhabdaceae bacterium]|nr:class I SAM-dependent methyltransferase [Syntrophorhabdaceae bacterium]HQE80504.1 class I SAM-dependent methyltransferase [Syntrophorhabdaceae bacterium]